MARMIFFLASLLQYCLQCHTIIQKSSIQFADLLKKHFFPLLMMEIIFFFLPDFFSVKQSWINKPIFTTRMKMFTFLLLN